MMNSVLRQSFRRQATSTRTSTRLGDGAWSRPSKIRNGTNKRSILSFTRNNAKDTTKLRCLSSSRKYTVEEAGRKAAAMAADESKNKNDKARRLSPSTLMAHAGMEHGIENAAMAPPLQFATTYTRPADGIYTSTDSIYSRQDNPTRLLLEKTIFELECWNVTTSTASSSFAFSSGMMAATAIILAHSAPLTVLIPNDIYHGVPTVLANVFERHNVQVQRVDMTTTTTTTTTKNNDNNKNNTNNKNGIQDAIKSISSDTDVIVWMETPSNPKCEVIDIQAICQAVKEYPNVTTVVDVTMASPVLTRPLELGADISMHSATKYLGGHSDALLGVATTSPYTKRGQELTDTLRTTQIATGGVASAMDSWLVLRGIRTLNLRVQQQSETALRVAEYLQEKIMLLPLPSCCSTLSAVHYPGLQSHPQYDIAKRQMTMIVSGDGDDETEVPMFGGVLSVEFIDEVSATAFAGALQTIQRATSLGGTETLIEHRASIEPPGRVTSPPGLLRISVGLEDVNDLIRDTDRALAIVEKIVGEADTVEE